MQLSCSFPFVAVLHVVFSSAITKNIVRRFFLLFDSLHINYNHPIVHLHFILIAIFLLPSWHFYLSSLFFS